MEPPDIIAGIRSRDVRVLERVVRSCLPGLLRAARAAGLATDRAEDAVQASLLVFVERAPDFDGRASACTWMHGILWRKLRESWRGERREASHDAIDDMVDARFDATGAWARPPQGPMEALVAGELQSELSACLARLPERQRIAFVLREVEGFTTEEACKILDVSANNLGVLLHRARNRLRECLEARGIHGSGDAAM